MTTATGILPIPSTQATVATPASVPASDESKTTLEMMERIELTLPKDSLLSMDNGEEQEVVSFPHSAIANCSLRATPVNRWTMHPELRELITSSLLSQRSLYRLEDGCLSFYRVPDALRVRMQGMWGALKLKYLEECDLYPFIAGGWIEQEVLRHVLNSSHTLTSDQLIDLWHIYDQDVNYPRVIDVYIRLDRNMTTDKFMLNLVKWLGVLHSSVLEVSLPREKHRTMIESVTDGHYLEVLLDDWTDGTETARRVRIIPTDFEPLQVIKSFDLDCLSALYDGEHLHASVRALNAWMSRTNVFRPSLIRCGFEDRVNWFQDELRWRHKYGKRIEAPAMPDAEVRTQTSPAVTLPYALIFPIECIPQINTKYRDGTKVSIFLESLTTEVNPNLWDGGILCCFPVFGTPVRSAFSMETRVLKQPDSFKLGFKVIAEFEERLLQMEKSDSGPSLSNAKRRYHPGCGNELEREKWIHRLNTFFEGWTDITFLLENFDLWRPEKNLVPLLQRNLQGDDCEVIGSYNIQFEKARGKLMEELIKRYVGDRKESTSEPKYSVANLVMETHFFPSVGGLFSERGLSPKQWNSWL